MKNGYGIFLMVLIAVLLILPAVRERIDRDDWF